MSTARLNAHLLTQLHGITLPRYDRKALRAGMVHIGAGAFHRAHQAVYTDDVLNDFGGDWGIIGASLRTATAADQLTPQDCLYTVNTLDPTSVQRRAIGSIKEIITAATASGCQRLLKAIADPAIHVVTLTVTEKGYCHLAGEFDADHPDVRHDLSGSPVKRSLPGILTAGLNARRRSGAGPITLISCDNLAGNGQVLSTVVTGFAELVQPDLLNWVSANVCFPSTMVDRIVPVTTVEDHAALTSAVGFSDQGMVCCERFRQWVIEDRFAGPRPPWERAGALLVDDVTPYETAKLRLLNGSHSACAYLGLLTGHQYIHQAMGDPALREFVRRLAFQEILPTVPALPQLNLQSYLETIFQRFDNFAVRYQTRQVATDGSQKLAQRLVPIARARLSAGQPIDRLALVFAAWIEHLQDPAADPLAATLNGLYRAHHDPDNLVDVIAATTPVWRGLNELDGAFTMAVKSALRSLRSNGLPAAMAASNAP